MESSKLSGMKIGLTDTPHGSLESLSEYTDAHEDTPSAPTEFLAEFLSAVMIRDYETALKYCKLILQYEPYNSTAKELYPLIVEKIQQCKECNSNEESGGEESSGDTDGTTASYSSLEDDEVLEYDNLFFGANGNGGGGGSTSTSSYLDTPSEETGHLKMQLLADHANGNNLLVAPPTSSEESSPTEPTASLLQPLSNLNL